MTPVYTTDYLCLLPFDFNDPTFIEYDNMVLDYGMGLDTEYLFKSALGILFELTSIEDILNYLDTSIFPEHVPNDSLSTCMGLCLGFINHLLSKLLRFKGQLNLMVRQLDTVHLESIASTVRFRFSID